MGWNNSAPMQHGPEGSGSMLVMGALVGFRQQGPHWLVGCCARAGGLEAASALHCSWGVAAAWAQLPVAQPRCSSSVCSMDVGVGKGPCFLDTSGSTGQIWPTGHMLPTPVVGIRFVSVLDHMDLRLCCRCLFLWCFITF